MTSPPENDGPITLNDFEAEIGGPSGLVPIPLGKPRSSEHVQALFRLAQARRITPGFEFSEVSPQKFAVKLVFGTVVIEDAGPFNSKKEAKESVCQKGLDTLKSVPEQPAGESSKDGSAVGVPQEPWLAVLNNWTQMAGCPAPSYQEFALGLSFACEVTISRRAEPFGSRNAGFANKKAARLNAAQAAVLWLRENSLFDVGDGPARKKRKKSMSSSPGTASPMLEVKDRHFAQQVEDLCKSIDLKVPDYYIKPDVDAPTFFSGHAVFTNAPGSFQDKEIGEVRHIRGRIAAKEACARKVLQFLDEHVQRSRARAEQDMEAARTAAKQAENPDVA